MSLKCNIIMMKKDREKSIKFYFDFLVKFVAQLCRDWHEMRPYQEGKKGQTRAENGTPHKRTENSERNRKYKDVRSKITDQKRKAFMMLWTENNWQGRSGERTEDTLGEECTCGRKASTIGEYEHKFVKENGRMSTRCST